MNMSRSLDVVNVLKTWIALASLLLLAGCGGSGFVVTGQVIDSDTGKPMPNVWVHQEWVVRERFSIPIADKGAAGTFPCVDEQVTKTDSNGRFRFERPPKLSYNPITKFPRALLRPLIPAYEHDHERSNGTGESKQTVAVKKSMRPQTSWLRDFQIELLFGRCPPISDDAPRAIDELLRTIANMSISETDFVFALGYIDPTRPRTSTTDPAITKRFDLYDRYRRVVGERK